MQQMILLTSSKGEPVAPLPFSPLLLPWILCFFQEKEVIFRKLFPHRDFTPAMHGRTSLYIGFLFHWKHTLKHFSQSEPVVWKRGDFYWPLLLLILSKLFRGQHKDGTFSKPLAQRMGENVCWVVWRESPPECPQLRVSGSSLEDVPLKC